MLDRKKRCRIVAIIGPIAVAWLIAPGCGGAETTTGSQVKDVQPEIRQQVQQSITKGYAADYKAKSSTAKKK